MQTLLLVVSIILLGLTTGPSSADSNALARFAARVPEEDRNKPFFYLNVAAAFQATDATHSDLQENMRTYATFARLNLNSWDRSPLHEFLLWNPSSDAAFSRTVGFQVTAVKAIAGWGYGESSGRPPLLLNIEPGALDQPAIAENLAMRGFEKLLIGDHVVWSRDGRDTAVRRNLSEPEGPFVGRSNLPVYLTIDRGMIAVSSTPSSIRAVLMHLENEAGPVRRSFIALANSAHIDGELIQFLHIPELMTTSQLTQSYADPSVAEKFNAHALLPRWESVALIDHQRDLRRMGTIALAYRAKNDARRAVAAIEERLLSAESIAAPGKQLIELFPYRRVSKIVPLHDGTWFVLITFEHVLDPTHAQVRAHSDHRPLQILVDSWLVGELTHLLAWQRAQ